VILTLTYQANPLYGSERTVCTLINVQTRNAKGGADLLQNRETLHCCHPCGCGGAFIAVGVIVVI
jgi:hypothetical protein